jgi:hypothetical protein
MVTSVTKSGTQKLPQKIAKTYSTDMTILEEHFLMLPSLIEPFTGKGAFADFFSK